MQSSIFNSSNDLIKHPWEHEQALQVFSGVVNQGKDEQCSDISDGYLTDKTIYLEFKSNTVNSSEIFLSREFMGSIGLKGYMI